FTVRLWDVATGLPLGEPFQGHTSSVLSVSFSPDGTCIVSSSSNSTVRLWDAATGMQLGEPFRGHTSSVESVSFSHDGTRIGASHHNLNSTTVLLKNDGWTVGANRRLLFWVPPASRQPFYSPQTLFVMPSGLDIDLSRMAHGEH
ncbi:WD40 repeat-like protein, partial [Suillus decipiens]